MSLTSVNIESIRRLLDNGDSILSYLQHNNIAKRSADAVLVFELLIKKMRSIDSHLELPLTVMFDEGYIDKDYRQYADPEDPHQMNLLRGVLTFARVGYRDLAIKMLYAGFDPNGKDQQSFVDCLCIWGGRQNEDQDNLLKVAHVYFELHPGSHQYEPKNESKYKEMYRSYIATSAASHNENDDSVRRKLAL